MTGRMKGNDNAIDEDGLFPFEGLVIIVAEAQLQQGLALCMAEIMFHPPAGVIAVCVGDDGIVYRSPGVDIKIALAAKQTFI